MGGGGAGRSELRALTALSLTGRAEKAARNCMQDTLQDLWPRSSRQTQTNKHQREWKLKKKKNTRERIGEGEQKIGKAELRRSEIATL